MSILSNAAPKKVLALTEAVQRGDYASARQVQRNNFFLINSLFVESNPAPTKAMLALMEKCSPAVRAPLVECSQETIALLKHQMKLNNVQ
uniref:Uncharacterized protein n=1 Tax=Globisporangium ultimum (strain ATCC 200006 / CBS 805.95 / DAOM BR144) TaxID=431595 RepID=K3X715_GLOUD